MFTHLYAASGMRTLITEEKNEPPRSSRRLLCLVAGEGFDRGESPSRDLVVGLAWAA
jgi:hypothetical protein